MNAEQQYNYAEDSYHTNFPSVKMIDEYMDEHECSVYDACDYFGITIDDYDEIANEKDERRNSEKGLVIDLGDRALFLLESLNELSKYSRVRGLEYAADTFSSVRRRIDSTSSLIESEKWHKQQAKEKFAQAFGSSAMIRFGLDSEVVDEITSRAFNEFMHNYTGPENKKRRDEFRKTLEKQTSSVK